MLNLILGRAGSGKTTLIRQQIVTAAQRGEDVMLIVPEQFSFESERALYRMAGPHGMLRIQVLSFTRLCNRIFREYGSLAGSYVDDASKQMLLSIALSELEDSLQVYRSAGHSAAFLSELSAALSELRQGGISPEMLRRAGEESGDGRTRQKFEELSLIYEGYRSLLEQGYCDPEEDLIRASALLEGRPYFEGRQVFVDGFMAFMADEMKLLTHAIAGAGSCTFALTCDGLHDSRNGLGPFSPVQETAARLIRAARERQVPVAAPTLLTGQHRLQSEALRRIEQGYLCPHQGEEACAGCPEGAVELQAAHDLHEEVEMVAAQICSLVRDRGYRYREIAVVTRDLSPYLSTVEGVFGRYGIPYFADRRADAQSRPLMLLVLAALEAVRLSFPAEQVLRVAKSPLSGLSPEEAAELENYAFVWNIRGSRWNAPFGNHPDGLSDRLTEEDRLRLEAVNRSREQVMGPLIRLQHGLRDASGEGFARAVYRYLTEIGAPERLGEFAGGFEGEGAKGALEESAVLWDSLIGILDVFGSVLGQRKFPLSRYIELMRIAVGAVDIGRIPQTLDQVLVGTADRIRPEGIRAAFLIGALEGSFPAAVADVGLFTDQERQAITGQGGALVGLGQREGYERYYAYFALTIPSERLVISYPRWELTGQGLQPSVLVSEARRILGCRETTRSRLPDSLFAANDATALDLFSRLLRRDPGTAAALREAALAQGLSDQVGRIEGMLDLRPPALQDRRTALQLFGRRMRLSPSGIERYHACPFSYFVSAGLRLRSRRRAEYSPLESGSVIHEVLQTLLERHGGRGLLSLEERTLRPEIEGLIWEYLSRRVDNLSELPARLRYLFRRLVSTLLRLVRRLGEEFSQSEFEPVAFEEPIGEGSRIRPLTLCTPDGVQIQVEGVVDRIDVMRKNGRRYVRVVDYKSGTKTFRLEDVGYGLNLQMLIYLFAIWEGDDQALPAGVLYLPARTGVASVDRHTPDSKVEAEHRRALRMNGLVLEDIDCISGMEREMAGVFIPVKRRKDGGFDRYSSLATLAEMGQIKRHVEQLIAQMGQALCEGQIPVRPVEGMGYDPCAYCEYWNICGVEEDTPSRLLDPQEGIGRIGLGEEGQDGTGKELDAGTASGD